MARICDYKHLRLPNFQAAFYPELAYYAGNEFRIRVHGNAHDNYYIQKAAWNAAPYQSYQISHANLVNGGLLELWLGPKPNYTWGISDPLSEKR